MDHPHDPLVLAFDFGGTKLAAAVINPGDGRLLSLERGATPVGKGAAASIEAMFALGRQAMHAAQVSTVARVGISFGGPVSADRQHVLHSFHVADWDGLALPEMASQAFGCPASMENDANAAALGVWRFDTHQPDHMIYIQVSTGVGAGLILGGSLYRGQALAGEFGHITALPGGPECTCGKHGCLESLCSGWAIARDGRAALWQARPDSPLFRLTQGQPDRADARVVIEAARAGDPLAQPVVQRAFEALGLVIANTVYTFDPDCIVLGGGITRAEADLRAVLEPVLARELSPSYHHRFKLAFSTLDGHETLLGAALLTD